MGSPAADVAVTAIIMGGIVIVTAIICATVLVYGKCWPWRRNAGLRRRPGTGMGRTR